MYTIFSALLYAIRYAIVALAILVATSFVFAYATHTYPVAVVGGSLIMVSAWDAVSEATEHYENYERRRAGESEINYSLPAYKGLRNDIRRRALLYLIEDKIVAEEGNTFIDGFAIEVSERVEKNIRGSAKQNSAAVARDVYGMDFEDYRMLILFPTARRDFLSRVLQNRGLTLEAVLTEYKIKKSIRVFFTPTP